MANNDDMITVPVDEVIKINGDQSIVCDVGGSEVVFPQSQIEWGVDPEEGEGWEVDVPVWIILDRGLEYLLDD